MKKTLKTILDVISTLIIIAAVILLVNVVFVKPGEVPNVAGYSLFRVLTGSMEPEIPVNSLIVVKKTDISDIEVGDIISFKSYDPTLRGNINTHRVVEIEDNDNIILHTKGDSNVVVDKYNVDRSNLIGKVVFISVGIGKALSLLSNPIIFAVIIIIPLLAMLIGSIVSVVKTAKKLSEQDDI